MRGGRSAAAPQQSGPPAVPVEHLREEIPKHVHHIDKEGAICSLSLAKVRLDDVGLQGLGPRYVGIAPGKQSGHANPGMSRQE